MAKLCLLTDDGAVAEYWEVGPTPMAVGRGATVDIRIADDGLSRRHFLIWREGDDYLIKDLSSRNGTWVVGDRAVTRTLRHNDFIVAGRSRFRFCEHGAPRRDTIRSGVGPHDTVVLPVEA